ncbi:MAG: hypothetical protein EOP86_25955 [Verrucomicrobiaceae bacterium]|nr:MAG: hypothetical protein EOP86_25955 [Verrucomicrobiaceae bacterium]
MNTFPVPFLRAVVLTAVCLLAAPAVSQAENPFKNIGGKIKSGVSNVGSAIKNTAKAAKNIVTTGKTEPAKAPPPRATLVKSSKPKTQSAGTASSKTKPQAAAKPRKSATAEASYKPKPKTTAPDSKPAKPKRKTPAADDDDSGDGDKPKTRKKPSSTTDESDTPPAAKRTGKPDGENPPEKSTATPEGWIEVPDASGEDTPAPSTETQPAAPAEALPFGTPAFGRKGFVYSPYAPEQGLIDVTNVAAGTKVRCPYTSKVFRVP